MTTANAYPDDIEALKAMLLERDARIGRLEDLVESHEAVVATGKVEIEPLKLLIAKLRRMAFGRSSEKLDRQIEQLELKLEDLEADEGAAPIEIPKTSHAAVEQIQRKPLPEHLPREILTHLPESGDTCTACGGAMKLLGEDVSEQLEYVPASFRVIRHVRPKLACSCCDRIAQVPAPSRPIERGLAGPGLLAHMLVAKFADHLPLYRQSVIYAREGVESDRSLLAKWVGHGANLLQPLVDALRRHVMAATKLHADDTPVPVLAPGNGKAKTERLWVYVRDNRNSGDVTPPAVWFSYTPDRQRHSSATAPRIVQRHAAGRCVWWLPGDLRNRACCRSCLLGTCPATVLRTACRSAECLEHRSARAHRRAAQDRGSHPGQVTRRTPGLSAGPCPATTRSTPYVAERDAGNALA